jgi:hypothetical protein
MSKLTYQDKVKLYDKPSVPEINKVTDANINNIKHAVNEATNYNVVTEDSAGKLKCNLTGELATGDIISISIPTLTNTSATMQLSVDGGTTYYYIKNMTADAVYNDFQNTELSNGKYILYFDGTYFILDKSKFGGKVITNANTITRNGFYTAFGTATGVPNSSYSWFITHQNSNAGTASAYQRAIAYSTDLIIYERTKVSGTWGNWVNRNIVNNLTTSSAGNGALDAYQGKVLNDKINNLKTYSTTETNTGKIWIDGKPIYRTCFYLTNPTLLSNWVLINVSTLNINEYTKIYGFSKATNDLQTAIQVIPRVVTDAIATYGIGLGDMSKTEIGIQFGTNYTSIQYIKLIVEYTKTTD